MSKVKDIQWFAEQREQILHRPDMWIGSCSEEKCDKYVYNSETNEMDFKSINMVYGLWKIFNEVLDNARDASINDTTVTQIKVTIDKDKGEISIWNNGSGIEVKKHPKYNLYGPEIIFGMLNSGTNYNDKSERLTGGTNGVGVKLTMLFSLKAQVECTDGEYKFTQTYSENLSKKSPAKITVSKVKPYVKITFFPDLKRFGLDHITDDMYDLLMTSVIHTAATTDKRVSVYFNGKAVYVKDFEKYMDLYIGSDKKENPRVFYSIDRWQVGLSISDDSFEQISFVNGIHTKNGGTHVKYITAQLVKAIKEVLMKRKDMKDAKITSSFIEQNLFVFVNCQIVRPRFDSQSKDSLNTKVSEFGSTCKLPEKFITDFIKKTNIVSKVADIVAVKEMGKLAKTSSKDKKKKIVMKKLEDAEWAGSKRSKECTLFIVEGDSAKAFAMSGFSVIGREKYGVFPLLGKPLNVRDVNMATVNKNKVIQSLFNIIGLKYGEKYSNLSSLRYGRICILTDSDVDGSHIKGLLINFIDCFWPELIKLKFVWTMNTHIVKAEKGSQVMTFYTLPEFEIWSKGRSTTNWFIKYYKGLGSSEPYEAKDCFKQMNKLLTVYVPDTNGRSFIDLAFRKKKADQRKTWLQSYNKETQLIRELSRELTLSNFIQKEFIMFSIEDNQRSIPNAIDGLKLGQRKIIWWALNRSGFGDRKKQIKVITMSGYMIAEMAYHHGPDSISNAIVGMAQDYVGSNNINLLMPRGAFGTRLEGGKDASNARYINTHLNPESRSIFPVLDDPILIEQEDEGAIVEPQYLVPILPMILINGASGVGTGFSTSIPSYNPQDIKANLIRLMKGQEPVEMVPWYRGYTGTIRSKGNGYESVGTYRQLDAHTVVVTELPIGRWTESYKEFLQSLQDEGEIVSFAEGSTDVKVEFVISFKEPIGVEDDMIQYLNLKSKGNYELMSTSNMYLFDVNGKMRKYDSPLEILKDFYAVRLMYYKKRKAYMCSVLKKSINLLEEKIRFIQLVSNDEIVIFKKKRSIVVDQLKAHEFEHVNKLLEISLNSFTDEKIQELVNQCNVKRTELTNLENKPVNVTWAEDLGKISS